MSSHNSTCQVVPACVTSRHVELYLVTYSMPDKLKISMQIWLETFAFLNIIS